MKFAENWLARAIMQNKYHIVGIVAHFVVLYCTIMYFSVAKPFPFIPVGNKMPHCMIYGISDNKSKPNKFDLGLLLVLAS